ncbi:KAP family P-loop NTPase fold protein [Shewanella baltica]|uniref:KAP family P-loop NTPase fold protein n=1 Tax=Shewanella baltica TaxID=62322 RepID=UPI00217DB2F4|nr:KAP family NTPase [Shewanella baltica]MCS6210200.1 hypothetical protein [Shewanella baltica]
MEATIPKQAKYADWPDIYKFENCLLNRGEYGQFLADYITGEHDGFVLNLNGGWGSGKTEFLKRFYSLLLERNHPVIYIDAWESDFSKDPLTVVTSELLVQLEGFNYNLDSIQEVEQFKKLCGKFIKGLAIGVSAYLSKKYLDDASIITGAVQQALSNEPDTLLTALSTEHQALVGAIKQIRTTLGEVAKKLEINGAKLPVVVLVDELDRCRPNYAIEMLEVIKHFFKTDNFVFVVATDTEQLVHSISAVYGVSFDSAQYLKRFFDRKASLPAPDLVSYIKTKTNYDIGSYSQLRVFPLSPFNSYIEMKAKIISSLAKNYGFKIRDVDQLLSKLDSCLRSMQSTGVKRCKPQLICFPALIIGLIEFELSFESFYKRTNSTKFDAKFIHSSDDIFKNLNISHYVQLSIQSTQFDKAMRENSYEEFTPKSRIISYQTISNFKSTIGVGTWAIEMLEMIINFEFNLEINYWLWDDYKRVIELAGNIE